MLQEHLPTDSQLTQHARYQNRPPPQHGEVLSTSQHAAVGTCCPSAAQAAHAHVRLTRTVPQEINHHTQTGWLEPPDPAAACGHACTGEIHTPAQHSNWQRSSRQDQAASFWVSQARQGPSSQEACVQGVRHCLVRRGPYVECRVVPTPPRLSSDSKDHHHHHRRHQPGDAYCRDTAAAEAAAVHSSMQLWVIALKRNNRGAHGPVQTQGPCVVHGILHSSHAVERRSRPGVGGQLRRTRAPKQTTRVCVCVCGRLWCCGAIQALLHSWWW